MNKFAEYDDVVKVPDATPWSLLSAQVERTPNRVAVVDQAERVTYLELSARVDAIAAQLVSQGIEVGDRIALMTTRSIDMVASAYAAWKLGVAYVPIDLAAPADRTDFMLADSECRVVLTNRASELNVASAVPVLSVTHELAAGVIESPASGQSIAYVMYTSGTTGRPKGVMIEQSSMLNLAYAHRERIYRNHLAEGAEFSASLTASAAFDGSVERLMLLLFGATLYIVDDEARRDPRRFVDFARGAQLDVLDTTPAFLAAALDAGLFEGAYRPSVVLVGGEAIPTALWQRLAAAPVASYNVYGPTEATVNAAVGRIAGSTPHLGHPLANTRIYFVDDDRQEVPVGHEGEMLVAGAGVGVGYWNRPELNAERFVVNPFSDESSYQRMYVTGDFGRINTDGTVEYLGRRDNQIKLRGYRIEVDEIARVLEGRGDVSAAVVALDAELPASPQLVAYVIATSVDPVALKAHAAEALPEYMVPSTFVAVDSIPLTMNGKVDYDVLAKMRQAANEASGSEVVFATPTADTLAGIWKRQIGVDVVSPQDNFFEIGGHSLLVVAMLTEAEEAFDVKLPMPVIFIAPTLQALADLIDTKR